MPESGSAGPGPAARPRLLVVASTFPRVPGDGTPAFVADLAARQADRFETLVLAPRVAGASGAGWPGYRVARFPYFPRRFERLAEGAILEYVREHRWAGLQAAALLVAEALAIRRAIRVFDPDVVHLHWLVPQGVAALLGGRSRPYVVTTHGGDLYGLRGRPWTAVKRAVVRRAAAATAVNADLADRLRALGAPPVGVHVLPMGADADLVRATVAGVPAEPGRLLFTGRLVEKKGMAVLLEALAALPAGTSWSLEVLGDGPLRPALERQVATSPALAGRVRFRGTVPRVEVARAWGSAAIGVFPSLPAAGGDQDGLPVALLEAMTAGRAVVASDLPGIDEVITDGTDGVLVPPGDPVALTVAVAGLLADPERCARLGAAAAARAADFSMATIGRRYVELLERVVAHAADRRPRPASSGRSG